MKITKVFKVTLDEPSPHWLCGDNLAWAVNKHIKKSGVTIEVEEITDSNLIYDLDMALNDEIPKEEVD